MSESGTLLLNRYGTRLPWSFYAPPSGNSETADTSASVPDTFPAPHPVQQQVLDEAARFNVLNFGRRTGKTELLLRLLAETALQGHPAAYFAPIYPMVEEVYAALETRLHGRITRRVQGHRIELDTGGVIDLWSMSNGGDRARGRKYKRTALDEVALVLGLLRFWEDVVRPTLIDLEGDAWFASTPRRGTDFERLYKREGADWRSWTFTTWDNPHISRQELEHARDTMEPEAYAREVMADFEATDSDLVYTLDRGKTIVAPSLPWVECTWHVAGIDPGGGDPTAIVPLGVYRAAPLEPPQFGQLGTASALHVGAHQYGEFRRKGNVSVDDMAEWMAKLLPVNQWDIVAVGETGGDVITTTLRRYGFNAVKANMSRDNIDGMVRWGLDSGRLTISPECQSSIAEFDEYRWYRKRDQSGEFFATSKADWTHGDLMDARRYAWMAVVDGVPARPRVVRIGHGAQRAAGVGVR